MVVLFREETPMVASEVARGFQDTAHQFRMTVILAAYSDGNEREIVSAV
jgi:hypothetical protein